MAKPQPMPARVDSSAGDMVSLVRLGLVEAPPIPQPPPEPPPAPVPAPDPAEEEQKAELNEALLGLGIEATAEDRAAVQALARLDTATVTAVARWLKYKKTKPDPAK